MTLSNVSRRKFMAGAAAVAGAAVLPSSASNLFAQDPVVNSIDSAGKPVNRERVPWAAVPFPMKQVRLVDGTCSRVQEKNRQYLHSLPNDRLAHCFKITAGLPSSAQPYGGWEKPDVELRGHFTGGHYLSAVALMYASTGDEDLKKKGAALVSDLRKCQVANKNGYLSAFPDELFDRLRERVRVWAPFYTIHKIMAGMLDMYVHTGNTEALQVAEDMADWVGMWTDRSATSTCSACLAPNTAVWEKCSATYTRLRESTSTSARRIASIRRPFSSRWRTIATN